MKTLLLTDGDTGKKIVVMFGTGAAVLAVIVGGVTKIFSVTGDDMATVSESPESISNLLLAA